MLYPFLIPIFSSLVRSESNVKTICVSDTNKKCPPGIDTFIDVKDFKDSYLYSGSIDLFLYSDISSVTIEARQLSGEINVYGDESHPSQSSLKFNFGFFFRVQYPINMHNVVCKISEGSVYAPKLLLDNCQLQNDDENNNKVQLHVNDLTSDALSLVNAEKVETVKFSLTKVQETLSIDVNVTILFSLVSESSITVFCDFTEETTSTLRRREVDIRNKKGKNSVIVGSSIALPTVTFKNITKKVDVVKRGFLNVLEILMCHFELHGGTLSFPEEEKWPLSLSLYGLLDIYFLNIVQNNESTIEIAAQNLPANIRNNGTDPLNIVTLAQKCGITGTLLLNSTLDKITSKLPGNNPFEFKVGSISKLSETAKLITDKIMDLYSEIEPEINTLSDKIRSVVEQIQVETQVIQKELFNLADGGHLKIDYFFEADGNLTSGLIIFGAEVKREGNGKFSLELSGGVSGGLSNYSFEAMKKLIGKPINLVCSKVNISVADWILKVFDEAFADGVFKLQYGDNEDGLHCVQLILTRLPDALSEKYCIGNNCPSGYVVVDEDFFRNLQKNIHEGTKNVVLNLKEALTTQDPINFTLFGGNASFSIKGNGNKVNVGLDLEVKDHVFELNVSDSNLNFSVKNEETNDSLEVNIPHVNLYDVTIEGQLKNRAISFTGERFATDLQTYQQLSKSSFNDLFVDLESTGFTDKVKTIKVGEENVEFRNSIFGSLIATLNQTNVYGNLGIGFDASFFGIELALEAGVSTTKGLTLEIKKSTLPIPQTLRFDDNWANLKDSGAGITVSHKSDVQVVNVPGNINLNFEGTGNVDIKLKPGTDDLKLNRKLGITGNSKISVNGTVSFQDISFSNNVTFEVEAMVMTGNSGNILDQRIIVEKATCEKNSAVQVGDLVVGDKLTLESGSSLRSNTISFKGKTLEIRYLFGGIPRIYATKGLSNLSKIILEYALKSDDENEVNYEQYIGAAQEIYCAVNETFTQKICQTYANSVQFVSDFQGLHGKTSAMKADCISLPTSDNKYIQTCLIAELSESPNLSKVSSSKAMPVAGVAIGVIVVIVIIVAVAIFIVIKKRTANKEVSIANKSLDI
ncbi:hypothetical protein TRFO_27230 [Tritrichomonas foetus]|uniref:Uncharacterized protein n=1 Tax=Tritrichomonas foetus TaxID=1144522 RepID=A0A1J4K642_9EUKA|nr:hypothetical protein TRFO_27230 [Tritrichomonas foetus]|eukprot:OHT05158.1 hypothetical protein TRFO_27230 [Tritrichomonas foetus]